MADKPRTDNTLHRPTHRSCCVTYIGHATVMIAMDGLQLLTDPLLRDRVGHLSRCSQPVTPSTYQNVDAVLVSHTHRDHLDLPSLRRLPPSARLVVPHGAARVAVRADQGPIQELRIGERTMIGSLQVEATHAEHNGNRMPFGRSAEALGFLIHGSWRVYFAGDTHFFPRMAELATRRLDVALLPVWGWGPGLGTNGHMDPRRAAEAVALIRPRVAIPIHWGTFRPMGSGRTETRMLSAPARLFARYAAELAPDVDVQVLLPGESVNLDQL